MTDETSWLYHIRRFFTAPSRAEQLEGDNATLEAFLDAFPGEYCGMTPDGFSVYSKGFCDILGIAKAQSLSDIQDALSPSDSAALEGLMSRLKEDGTPFTLIAESFSRTRHYKLSGARGQSQKQDEKFHMLWVRDITAEEQARRENEQELQKKSDDFTRMQTALGILPRPVWIRNDQQDLIWVNETYCSYLGKDVASIIDQQIEITAGAARRSDSDKGNIGRNLAKTALTAKQPQDTNHHGVFHGKRLLLRLSEHPMQDLGMTLGFAYDITREEELESEMNRFHRSTNELLEHMRSAIAIFDATQHLVFYNSAFTQLWELESGWLDTKPKLGELMEKLRDNRKLPEQADFRSFKQSWLDMFTNLIKPQEDMLYLPDSSALRMLVVPHTLGGLMMTFEDVTSRLALESSYNTLMAVQRETLDNLAEAVSVFGGDGRLKLWNPAYASLWDLSAEDLESEPHINSLALKKQSFFTADSWETNKRRIIEKALKHNLAPKRITCDNGSKPRLLDVSSVPLPDGGALVTYRDITSAVEIENALREKALALETAEQLKTDFLANMSYQLRTPLNSIMGFTDILSNEYFGPLNERQKDYTLDIHQASEKLLSLVNNILDLSTLDAGFMALERADFTVSDMLHTLEDMVIDWARKEKIELLVRCDDTLDTLNADQKRIQQALINLVRNALSFTPEGGQITVEANAVKNAIHFTVTDTGAGIAKEDTARIFKPFERAQSGQKHSLSKSGAGIGLSLVRKIAEAHNGSVDLTSEEGKGTAVTLIIPQTSVKTCLKIPAQS